MKREGLPAVAQPTSVIQIGTAASPLAFMIALTCSTSPTEPSGVSS